MPTISRFYGISITMYFGDHPPPHFHVFYAGDSAKIDIQTLRVIKGHLPRRALGLVLLWAEEHRDELEENWRLLERREPLQPIAPLD